MQRAKIGILGLSLVIGGIAVVTQAPARSPAMVGFQPASLNTNDVPAVVLLGYDVAPTRVERIRTHQVWACNEAPGIVRSQARRAVQRLPFVRAF